MPDLATLRVASWLPKSEMAGFNCAQRHWASIGGRCGNGYRIWLFPGAQGRGIFARALQVGVELGRGHRREVFDLVLFGAPELHRHRYGRKPRGREGEAERWRRDDSSLYARIVNPSSGGRRCRHIDMTFPRHATCKILAMVSTIGAYTRHIRYAADRDERCKAPR